MTEHEEAAKKQVEDLHAQIATLKKELDLCNDNLNKVNKREKKQRKKEERRGEERRVGTYEKREGS